jgi:hypothetical protein
MNMVDNESRHNLMTKYHITWLASGDLIFLKLASGDFTASSATDLKTQKGTK